MSQLGFFDLSDHFSRLSERGDPLQAMNKIIDFEGFCTILDMALQYSDGKKGGRPPYDPVAMFKVLILAAQSNVSDERMEFLICDRLSWLRFLGFELGKPTPDENTIRCFRERLTKAGAIEVLFEEFDRQVRSSGYLAMGGQIIDATLVAAPRQRNTQEEKQAIKDGKRADEIWPDAPNKALQKDTDARWTVKIGRPKDKSVQRSVPELAIPHFGYKNHISIDQRYGFIRGFAVTSAARHDGALLRNVVSTNNTGSRVWADTAYGSKKNEAWLAEHGRTSMIHDKKPKGRPMSDRTSKSNAKKSAVRAKVEHVFAHQKSIMGLFVRTIGLTRAKTKIALVNLAYNMNRFIFHEKRASVG